jgi:hypothetical protein
VAKLSSSLCKSSCKEATPSTKLTRGIKGKIKVGKMLITAVAPNALAHSPAGRVWFENELAAMKGGSNP